MINYSLRDKEELLEGLKAVNSKEDIITLKSNLIYIDSNDCKSLTSINDAQNYFEGKGGRKEMSGNIKSVLDTSPITIIIEITCEEARIKNWDNIIISGIPKLNGLYKVINCVSNRFCLYGINGVGNINGMGSWLRERDDGYPEINNEDNVIDGSTIIVKLNKRLKLIKQISLLNTSVPRDIIPINVYITDLIDVCTRDMNTIMSGISLNVINSYVTYILQEKKMLEEMCIGLFSTPLCVFRTYIDGLYSIPSSITPSPLILWNPPLGDWPLQPLSYPYQTVPTYKTNEFKILANGNDDYYLILSGYGVYDLNDFSIENVIVLEDSSTVDLGPFITEIARKLLLLLIVQPQSYKDVDYIDLIFNSNVISYDNMVFPYGYGDYQRFIPGPGLGMNYQPGTSDGANPTVPNLPDWPICFPNFNGNVWGPYDSPGSRFQKVGTLQTLQDLFLNGDLNNLYGDPIIKQDITIENLMFDNTFGLNFNALNIVTLENISDSTNLNIINAMRVYPNGFGTVVVRSQGYPLPNYVNVYQNGGGIGPDPSGIPANGGGAWVNNGLYLPDTIGSYQDPIASGPNSSIKPYGITPNIVNSLFTGDEILPNTTAIPYRESWYTYQVGQFKNNIISWKNVTTNNIQETKLVIQISNQQDTHIQGTNPSYFNSILSIPIRFNVSTDSGNLKYVENLSGLLIPIGITSSLNRVFNVPISSLLTFKISFSTYNGIPINLEKMLQEKKSVNILRIIEKIYSSNNVFNQNNSFLNGFNPLNSQLQNRMKRNISLIFNFMTYEYQNVGLNVDLLSHFVNDNKDNDDEFNVRAFNSVKINQ